MAENDTFAWTISKRPWQHLRVNGVGWTPPRSHGKSATCQHIRKHTRRPQCQRSRAPFLWPPIPKFGLAPPFLLQPMLYTPYRGSLCSTRHKGRPRPRAAQHAESPPFSFSYRPGPPQDERGLLLLALGIFTFQQQIAVLRPQEVSAAPSRG